MQTEEPEEPTDAESRAYRYRTWLVIGLVLTLLWLPIIWGLVSLALAIWHDMQTFAPATRHIEFLRAA